MTIYIHKKRDQLIDIMSLRAALTVSAYVIWSSFYIKGNLRDGFHWKIGPVIVISKDNRIPRSACVRKHQRVVERACFAPFSHLYYLTNDRERGRAPWNFRPVTRVSAAAGAIAGRSWGSCTTAPTTSYIDPSEAVCLHMTATLDWSFKAYTLFFFLRK